MINDISNHSPILMVQGLRSIHKKISNYVHENPVQGDLIPDQRTLNAWPHMTMTYSLLEQSLKAVVNSLNSNYRVQEMKEDSHHLNLVYGRLDPDVKASLSDGYRTFQSLHNYISYMRLDEFMAAIDDGYVKWRYFPLQGWKCGNPGKNSAAAMLEVSRHAIDIFAAQVATDHGLHTVDKRLKFKFRKLIEKYATSLVNQDGGEGLETIVVDWMNDYARSPINALSSAVRCIYRDKVPLQNVMPVELVPVVTSVVNDLYKLESTNLDLRLFLNRVVNDEEPLWWNETKRIFS